MIGLLSTCSLIIFIASSIPSTSLRFGAKSECESDENDNRCCPNAAAFNLVAIAVAVVAGAVIIHALFVVVALPTKRLRRIHPEITGENFVVERQAESIIVVVSGSIVAGGE